MAFFKIIQAHILFLHPTFIITVAVEVEPGSFTCYYKQSTAVSDKDIRDTVKKGKILSEKKARELFSFKESKYISSI